MDYISVKEAATKWGVSERHVRRYCNEHKIKGAIIEDGVWIIPENTNKPTSKSRANVPFKRELTVSSLAKRVLYEHSKNNHFGVYEYIQVNLAYSSCRMASNRLTREQVTSLFRTNKVAVGFEPMKVDDIIEIINHFASMHLILDQVMEPISQELIKRVHTTLFYGTYADRKKVVRPGLYRCKSHKYGVKPTIIQQEMASLITSYEQTPNITLETLLDFHVRFENIHPFEDGNGRVGRILLIKECLRFGICPFIIDDKRRGEYHKGIATWSTDSTHLVDVCTQAQDRFIGKEELLKLMDYCRPPVGRGAR
jgi:Fic family protein